VIAYLDSSALVKLVIEEAETEALRATLPRFQALVSSELALVEVTRASRRVHGDRSSRTVADVFRAVSLLRLDRRSRALDDEACCRAGRVRDRS
jgi:predicted nucleic acid-binding protein